MYCKNFVIEAHNNPNDSTRDVWLKVSYDEVINGEKFSLPVDKYMCGRIESNNGFITAAYHTCFHENGGRTGYFQEIEKVFLSEEAAISAIAELYDPKNDNITMDRKAS